MENWAFFFKLKSVHIMWPSQCSNWADVRAQCPRWQWEPAGPRLDVSVCWAEDLVSDVNGVWWCSGPCVMCAFAVAGSLCIHMCMCLVSLCVSGRLCLYCSMRDHACVWGPPQFPNPPRGLHRRLETLADTLPPAPVLVCSPSASAWENTNRGAAFVRHKSPLPLKLPAPLFSCPNSTAIKLSWQPFRKQLRREEDEGSGGDGGGGVGKERGGLHYPPTSTPPHLYIHFAFPSCLRASRCHRSALLPAPLNKDLTSFLFSLLIRFPQKCLLVFTKGQDKVLAPLPVAAAAAAAPPDMSVSIQSQSPDDINHGQISLR